MANTPQIDGMTLSLVLLELIKYLNEITYLYNTSQIDAKSIQKY